MDSAIGNRIGSGLTTVEGILSVLAHLSLLVMTFAITIDAILRYAFSSPLPAVHSITELYLLPFFVFGAAAHLQKEEGNINVDILRKNFSSSRQYLVNIISRAGALPVFGAMAWFTFQTGVERVQAGAALSGVVALPTGYTWLFIAFGLTMLCVRLLRQLVSDVGSLLEGDDVDRRAQSVTEEVNR